MKVAIVGASGETGGSIVKALLESSTTKFDITALTRPASLTKPENLELEKLGVKLVACDLDGPEHALVKSLSGQDVVISALEPAAFGAQIPLANASKVAGVKRFVPCAFATIAPPGVMKLRDDKEDIFNHVKKLYLPYTIIDVGWWFQLAVPRLSSGKTDYAIVVPENTAAGDGDVPSAFTDIRDIGQYVAMIISDPRTLNKMVFAYDEVATTTQIYELVEKLSGENIDRTYLSADDIEAGLAQIEGSDDPMDLNKLWILQYLRSCGIRGDNNPEYARYLGYMDAKELYPDFKGNTLEKYFQEVLDGKAKSVYKKKKA
ncbi:hypothetical protein LCI18_003905 [Fusarium solani-melongenae]|uniref:Uncharacterized protein n=1 Tax=Fusarium solani subsp. cucurbitae TaxID=2747967 RepID=A0ACD3YVI9_FUSSC|nr:hypothetical protein LCI18_003905 [Fusarium solani-melongenae]